MDPPKLKIRLGSSTKGPSERGDGHVQPSTLGPASAAPSPLISAKGLNGHHNGEVAAAAASQLQEGYANGIHSQQDDDQQHFKAPLSAQQAAAVSHAMDATGSADSGRKSLQGSAVEQSPQETQADKERREEQLLKDLAELPSVARQSLVPLYEVVRRSVAHSYAELQNVVEVLPSQSDHDRKRTIIEYVITTRRQIVKLLVLLRWAKENTQDTERSINLIAFLQRQNFQLERAIQALKGVEGLLSGARVRNYDLVTAVEVLTSGTYTKLPKLFKDSFLPPPKLSNAAVVTLLHDLEAVIRLRLQMHETIPPQFLQRRYSIHDGRVTFHCPSYFKAAFTLGGDSIDDQWYLVDFRFSFRGRDVQQQPGNTMREHILQLCNAQLAESAAAEKEARSKIAESIPPDPAAARGKSFVRAFDTLQNFTLNYQLELINYQAIQTNVTPTLWQDMLSISFSREKACIDIKNLALSQAPLPLAHQGAELRYEEVLSISIAQRTTSQSTSARASRLSQLAKTIETVPGRATMLVSAQARANAGQAAATAGTFDRYILATFTREGKFVDSKGRRVAPPVQRKVDTSKITQNTEVLEQSSDTPALIDLDVLLSRYFSLKPSMLM